jgi:PST family polysaccharide transporter
MFNNQKSDIIEKIKLLTMGYSKVIENYFFMTSLQVISAFIGIIMYPFVISAVGAHSYGVYVIAVSTTYYFITIVNYGFNYPAMKALIENRDDFDKKSKIVSSVLIAKLYLLVLVTIIFLFLLFLIPIISNNKLIFIFVFTQVLSTILFPIWYFQAVQKMRTVTYINLIFRLLTIPAILYFVSDESDIVIFSAIISLSVFLAAISSTVYILKIDKIKIQFINFSDLKKIFVESFPFFGAASIADIKFDSVTLIIAMFFGTREVAVFDLANKIITIPRMLTQSINGALFPKIIQNSTTKLVKKIIRFEFLLGVLIIVVLSFVGMEFIKLFGNNQMNDAYPILITISFSIMTWMIVGCYNYFVFIPKNKNNLIAKNQIVSIAPFLLFNSIAIYMNELIYIAIAFSLSGFFEVLYCRYLIFKNKLFD